MEKLRTYAFHQSSNGRSSFLNSFTQKILNRLLENLLEVVKDHYRTDARIPRSSTAGMNCAKNIFQIFTKRTPVEGVISRMIPHLLCSGQRLVKFCVYLLLF